jgi:Domain of unknown function DUF29
MAVDDKYETDFYAWTRRQAELARRRCSNELDWDNIAEELEGLSRSEARELFSRFQVLLAHLLKWIVQPERRSRSWRNTIANQRDAIARHLGENPSLKAREAEEFAAAYIAARRDASSETDLELTDFPGMPPFSLEQAKDEAFWPE